MTRFIARWDPYSQTMTLRDAMSHLLEESYVRAGWATRSPDDTEATLRLPVDAYTTEDHIVVVASVPGVKPENVDITIEGDTLTIKGEIPALPANGNAVLQERGYGRFSRTLLLNVAVQADQASAEFENGVVTVTIPKAEAVRPRSIKVSAK